MYYNTPLSEKSPSWKITGCAMVLLGHETLMLSKNSLRIVQPVGKIVSVRRIKSFTRIAAKEIINQPRIHVHLCANQTQL